uniref:Ig-like domain-containing protein n=1 Tax=Lates calcarifer TaxID=8187 RepID=A0A4W6E397_LATCA
SPSWKYLFYHPHGSTEVTGARQLRGAFSDTEDFLDHGLVSANRCSSRTSSISSWTDNIKPSFTKKLKFQSVLEGQPVELKCKLVACPPPTILWFHNNRSIPKERRRKICTDSRMHMHTTSLVIDSIKEKDSGSYKVMAINTEGSAETTASLLVSLREEQSANYLGFVKRSAKAHESNTAVLECAVTGEPAADIAWYCDDVCDKKIPHNNKKYLHSSDGDNHFLKICKVSPQDSGVYTCRAINVVGETLCRASLVVINAKAFSGKTRGRELTAVSLGSAKVQPQKFDLMLSLGNQPVVTWMKTSS